jgi:Kef-type K+ transport system membrane component KefB
MHKSAFFYLGALLLTVAAVAALLALGKFLHPEILVAALPGRADANHPLALLLLQITVILLAARATGALFRYCGQPAVIGEIAAGLLLGPSALGLAWPELMSALFPPASLPPLQWLSQIGVLLFMFCVGTDIDLAELRHKARAALVISHTSIALPFALGVMLALIAFPLLAAPGVSFHAFALFIGIAMSITAFPVLARILQERGLNHTALGRTVVACAAVDDVTAWCLLALVIALAPASASPWHWPRASWC